MKILVICIVIIVLFFAIRKSPKKSVQNVKPELLVKDFSTGNCDIKLVYAGDNKIRIVKEVMDLTGFGLKESKDIVDNVPLFICTNIDEQEAIKFKQKVEKFGALVNIETSISNSDGAN